MIEKKVSVTVFRYSPEVDKEPRYETYAVPYRPEMFVLDALTYIRKNLGASLAFRYSCRSRRCGSCAVLVDGIPSLSCKKKIEGDVTVQPLPGFPFIRDLVVDFNSGKGAKVRPFQPSEKMVEELEMLPADSVRNFIDLTKCISCYICLSACPVTKESSDSFVGPEQLLQMARRAHDPRDSADRAREACSGGLYNCTTCSTCEKNCPKGLNPVDAIIDLRNMAVEKGVIASTIKDALESVFKNGNPWGGIRNKRSNWATGLSIKHVSEDAELLLMVGCTPSYDPRVQKVARSLVACFEKAKINFGTLANEESCCGNEVYGMGEKGLFEFLVEKNLKTFTKYGVTQIVTISPHCYHAFKNRYPKTNFEVQHYTQYIADLVDKGKLTFSKEVRSKITYHDPCFLGKQNGIYDPPRKILSNITGANFIELERSKERSLCCGGGGGRMWIDTRGKRLSEIRVKEAVETGAEILATACPFCLLTFDDAVRTAGFEGVIQVMDIAELLSEII